MKMTPQQEQLQQILTRVQAYIPQIPSISSSRTYQVKKETGRHCTLPMLQKFVRDKFVSTYKIPYGLVPEQYRREIERMVEDAYEGMKEARKYEK